jgi:hypothetical protein
MPVIGLVVPYMKAMPAAPSVRFASLPGRGEAEPLGEVLAKP